MRKKDFDKKIDIDSIDDMSFDRKPEKATHTADYFRYLLFVVLTGLIIIAFFTAKYLDEKYTQINNIITKLESDTVELENKITQTSGNSKNEIRKLWVSAYKNNKDAINGLSSKIKELESARTTLSKKISALESDKRTLNKKLTSLESDKNSLNIKISALEFDKNALNEKVTKLESDKKTLIKQVNTLKTSSTVLINKLEKLESDKTSLGKRVTALETVSNKKAQ